MIVKRGTKYILTTKDGKKILGVFKTLKAAKEREKEILFFSKG